MRPHTYQRTASTCGWDPSAQSDNNKSEQVKQCMDLRQCLNLLHLEPTHLLYYTTCTGYTWSPLTCCTTLRALATLGTHSPAVLHWLHWQHLEPTHLLYYTGCTWGPLTCCTTLPALAAHSPAVLHYLHLEPTHLLYYTTCTGCTWSPLTCCTPLPALATLGAHSPAVLHWLH
jgi:hypothetical protein